MLLAERADPPKGAVLRGWLDGSVAAGLVHGMALVTRNVKDFARFDGLDIIDPWHPQ